MLFGAACGGTADGHAAQRAGRAVTTSVAPARATTTSTRPSAVAARPQRATPAAVWHGDRTRPPAVGNTGRDYVAIYRSLDGYRMWLQAHAPDPAKVDRVWSYGSEIADEWRRLLARLQRRHQRWATVGFRSSVRVVSVTQNAVTLLVDEDATTISVLDEHGVEIHREPQAPSHSIALLHRTGDRWFIAAFGPRLDTGTEVHL